jgi:hypothetical protein
MSSSLGISICRPLAEVIFAANSLETDVIGVAVGSLQRRKAQGVSTTFARKFGFTASGSMKFRQQT